jgi:hypothetical protein
VPRSSYDVLVALLCMACGISMIALLIGSMAEILTQATADARRARSFRDKLLEVCGGGRGRQGRKLTVCGHHIMVEVICSVLPWLVHCHQHSVSAADWGLIVPPVLIWGLSLTPPPSNPFDWSTTGQHLVDQARVTW